MASDNTAETPTGTVVEGQLVNDSAAGTNTTAAATPSPAATPSTQTTPTPTAPPPPTAVETVDDEMLEAATRLLVGALVEGSVQFRERLKAWDEKTAVSSGSSDQSSASQADQIRYTLIGMLFHAEAHLKTRQIPLFKQAAGLAFYSFSRLTAPAANSRISRSVNGRMDKWAARGETFVNKWMATGKLEEEHGRNLALTAVEESIDDFINDLAKNKELQSLIAEQSMGLATESVDNVRERAVTSDALAERFVRSLLRRPPRTTIGPTVTSEPQDE